MGYGVHLDVTSTEIGSMEQLTDQAAKDLDSAFPRIVVLYGPTIFTTALRVSQQSADAEDLAAETFVRAYAALRTYSPKRIRELKLRAWLVTITLNLWRNQLRDASRVPTLVQLDSTGSRADPTTLPEQRALDHAGWGEAERLLDNLADFERIPVVLRHVVGLSYREIAMVLDCPVGTAKSHVNRGMATLRKQLGTKEEGSL